MDAFSVIVALTLFIAAVARTRSWIPVVALVIFLALALCLASLLGSGHISPASFVFVYRVTGLATQLVYMWAIFNPFTFRSFFHGEGQTIEYGYGRRNSYPDSQRQHTKWSSRIDVMRREGFVFKADSDDGVRPKDDYYP